MFRPLFFNTDSMSFSVTFRSEGYYNDNAPNQENMDVRYMSKGIASFNSVQMAFNSPYFSFMAEPYLMPNKFLSVDGINRGGAFSVLNDRPLAGSKKPESSGLRNILAFFHYKGLGFGWHEGNRWWGPGIHSSFQMTNNTQPLPAQIIGTIQEIRIGSFGFYGLYTFAHMNEEVGVLSKYYTSLNGQLSWYGPVIISAGFSRNYLTGGVLSAGYEWTEKDARNIVFEGIFTSDLIGAEHTVGGHDVWDQTLSGYFSITLPKRDIKIYTEIAFNDNRMYYADFFSQPDHSMATVFGVRDYGIGNNKNWAWGFEWTNLMITYSSRHRPTGPGTWYNRGLYDYSSYYGRRWGAHSGTDSDDWYIYAGYLSDKLMVIPALNYERHGIVSHRPAEVKMEFRLDTRYKYKDIWFGIYYEKQFEAFLGFPDYFYVDGQGNQIDASEGKLANTRRTNTIILSMSKTINF
ncbi:MAG: hypothetical protein HOF58_08105 [Candidatus Marinimicrobia bacterium]|nr:hypothetical protein [Candidatus Neomarinimicrobiota bacterium]